MRFWSPLAALVVVALLGAGMVACDSDSGSGTTDTTSPADTGNAHDVSADVPIPTGACHECLAVGMAFRFSALDVLEPSEPPGLPAFLNGIWKPDVNAYRLNIILQIASIEDNGDGSKTISFTAGSGWHDLTMEQILPVQGGDDEPTSFTFVGGSTTEFTAVVDADCNFETRGATNMLWFHPGPFDHALICSAGDDTIDLPKDTIPIANLVAHGAISDTCDMIVDARLDGCIAAEAACQICSFGPAPNYSQWNYEQDPEAAGMACEASYCQRWCGRYWANFGGFVQGIGVPLACDIDSDGTMDAYLLSGDWEATQVPMD